MNKYTALTILILAIALGVSVNRCRSNSQEKERYAGNQSALMHRVRFYKASDSTNAASVERLKLTIDEIQIERAQDAREIKSLKIKLSRVQSISTTTTEATYQIKPQVRDSIIYREGKSVILKCVEFEDPYLTFSGCTEKGTFSGTIQSRDTLKQIVHRVPRKFLFLRYGTKAIRQEVKTSNPHSKITYTEYIEIEK